MYVACCRRFLALFLSGCWGTYGTGAAKLNCWVINSPLVFWFFGFFIINVFTIHIFLVHFCTQLIEMTYLLKGYRHGKKSCKLNFGSKLKTSFNFVHGQTGPGSGFWQCFRLVWSPLRLFESVDGGSSFYCIEYRFMTGQIGLKMLRSWKKRTNNSHVTNVNSLLISIYSFKAAYLINFSIFIDFRWWAFKWKLYVFIIALAFYLFILVYILLFNTFHLHILCQCFSPPRLPSLQLFLSLPFPVHQYSSPPPLPQLFLSSSSSSFSPSLVLSTTTSSSFQRLRLGKSLTRSSWALFHTVSANVEPILLRMDTSWSARCGLMQSSIRHFNWSELLRKNTNVAWFSYLKLFCLTP